MIGNNLGQNKIGATHWTRATLNPNFYFLLHKGVHLGIREVPSFCYQPVLLLRYNMMRIAVIPIPPEVAITRTTSRGGA